nr:uncharacterized protein LOC116435024 [Nomia melanderi]
MDMDKEFRRQKSVTTEATRADEINRSAPPMEQHETIKDSQSAALRLALNAGKETPEKNDPDQSPMLPQRMSRTETVRQDVRKLKTVTLNRMGKMFKQRSQTPIAEKSSSYNPRSAAKSVENYDEQPSKKEKSNSLGRMLKLVDKDGSPKKLFHPRAGSLSRMLRRHSNNENNDEKKDIDDTTPGIFSRMLNQLRGRPQSGSSVKRNTAAGSKSSSLPPKAPTNSRMSNFSSSTTVASPATQTQKSLQKLVNLEYSV